MTGPLPAIDVEMITTTAIPIAIQTLMAIVELPGDAVDLDTPGVIETTDSELGLT
jgi:hypothetical protein